MLAFHPGNGYVEKAMQPFIQNRLGQHEIRPFFERYVHRGGDVHYNEYHRKLVGSTAAYVREDVPSSRDIVVVNDEAIEVTAS
jgi:hypothetical protein